MIGFPRFQWCFRENCLANLLPPCFLVLSEDREPIMLYLLRDLVPYLHLYPSLHLPPSPSETSGLSNVFSELENTFSISDGGPSHPPVTSCSAPCSSGSGLGHTVDYQGICNALRPSTQDTLKSMWFPA